MTESWQNDVLGLTPLAIKPHPLDPSTRLNTCHARQMRVSDFTRSPLDRPSPLLFTMSVPTAQAATVPAGTSPFAGRRFPKTICML